MSKREWVVKKLNRVPELESYLNELEQKGFEIHKILQSDGNFVVIARRDLTTV